MFSVPILIQIKSFRQNILFTVCPMKKNQKSTDNMPYPHKFNDALLKAHLTNLDFAVKHNLWKEHAEHEVYILGPILEMIKGWIPEHGPDRALYGMFEGNSCNFSEDT